MAKCPKCGEELVDFLFSSGHCPNSCDKGDTPLGTPEETIPGYDKGIYQECKDRKEQKRKMLESLANANKAMWQFVGAVEQFSNEFNALTIYFKEFVYSIYNSIPYTKLTLTRGKLVDYDKWMTSFPIIHNGNFHVYKHKDRDFFMILDKRLDPKKQVWQDPLLPKNSRVVIMSYKGRCYACDSDTLQVIAHRGHFNVDCAECGIHGRCANTVQEAMDEWEKLYNRHLKYSLMNEEKDGTDHPKDAEYYEEWYRQEYVCDFSHKSNDDRKEVEREIIESFKTPTWIINPNDRTNE